ncbi:MAG: hypothetical protein WC389_19775 [Lutibacter sp.]|jgi:hypothetical protein
MVTIIRKNLVTIRFNKKEADEIFDRACTKGKTVGQYVKWFMKQSLSDKTYNKSIEVKLKDE